MIEAFYIHANNNDQRTCVYVIEHDIAQNFRQTNFRKTTLDRQTENFRQTNI